MPKRQIVSHSITEVLEVGDIVYSEEYKFTGVIVNMWELEDHIGGNTTWIKISNSVGQTCNCNPFRSADGVHRARRIRLLSKRSEYQTMMENFLIESFSLEPNESHQKTYEQDKTRLNVQRLELLKCNKKNLTDLLFTRSKDV